MAGASDPSPLVRRLGSAVVLVVALVGLPLAAGAALAGVAGARAAATGALFGVLLGMRAGWRTALRTLPVLLVAVAASSLASGTWWWVALLAVLGAAAGIGSAHGLLVPVGVVGVFAAITQPLAVGEGLLARLAVSAAGAVYALAAARRIGFPASLPGPSVPGARAATAGLVLGTVAAAAAALALLLSDPHAYWIPVTVFLLVLPAPGLRLSRAAAQRVIGTALGWATAMGVALLTPSGSPRVVLGSLVLVLVVAVPHPLWLNAALTTVLLVTLLAPADGALGLGATRLVDVAVAAVLVLAGAAVLARWDRRRAPGPAEREVLAELLDAQGVDPGATRDRTGGTA